MAIFQSSQILSSDGTVYSFSPTTATIDGFSFTIPESFDIYYYDVLKVDENTNLLVGSASSIDGDGSGIFYTTFDSDGFSSEPITVLNESRNSNQSSPQIAKNDTEIFVTWYNQSSSHSAGHFFDLSLNSVGDQITFSGGGLPVSAGDMSFSVFRVYGGGRTLSQNEISSDGLIRDEIVIDAVSDTRFGAITATDGNTWLTKTLYDGYSYNVYLGVQSRHLVDRI